MACLSGYIDLLGRGLFLSIQNQGLSLHRANSRYHFFLNVVRVSLHKARVRHKDSKESPGAAVTENY
jgi:hypothetical protein